MRGFIEYRQGNRCVGLGYAFPKVIEAVRQELNKRVNFGRRSGIEVEATEELPRAQESELAYFASGKRSESVPSCRPNRSVLGQKKLTNASSTKRLGCAIFVHLLKAE